MTGDDKPVSSKSEVKRCGGIPLLTDLALMMRVDPLALIFGLREFVPVAYVVHVYVAYSGGLISTASKVKRNERTLADTRLEIEVISQCGSGGLDDYKASRTNMAKMKLEGQLDMDEYSRFTVPKSVHMGDPAGGYLEMVKTIISARGRLISWNDKQAMQEYLKELITGSNLKRKEHGTVISTEANENGLELQSKVSWKAALQKYFDETIRTPSSVIAYLAISCVRTILQVRLVWCLVGIRKWDMKPSLRRKLERSSWS